MSNAHFLNLRGMRMSFTLELNLDIIRHIKITADIKVTSFRMNLDTFLHSIKNKPVQLKNDEES